MVGRDWAERGQVWVLLAATAVGNPTGLDVDDKDLHRVRDEFVLRLVVRAARYKRGPWAGGTWTVRGNGPSTVRAFALCAS